MNPGRFDEHPMPETTSTLCAGIPSSTMASFSDFKTPKSPHPGHQSGSTAPWRLLSVSSTVAMAVPFLARVLRGGGLQVRARRETDARLEQRGGRLPEAGRDGGVPPV